MKVDKRLAVQRGYNNCELSKEKKKKQKKNKKKKSSMPKVVQKLYETCKQVFAEGGADFVPSPEDIERLRSVLDSMKPANVGLTPDMPYFKATETEETPLVTYLHLYECDKFSIGIFCLPPSGVIPLHNHPHMTVFSKLLFGSMHIKSYDWVADRPSSANESVSSSYLPSPGIHLAKIHIDSDFTAPCDTSILFPASGGNMHCFTALTSCAVLDVLGPPYSDSEGRHCSYYNDFPYATFSGDTRLLPEEDRQGHAWLEEREKPDNFIVDGAMYTGPKIVET
ncbi:hypothetical protein L1049_028026 [Liquidambar formosana]|uniref:cysteine dioxygenase n=1 Tax=Liquidambar formosana TaxID=63359 RepID=A0AAP0RLW3_LIQFO